MRSWIMYMNTGENLDLTKIGYFPGNIDRETDCTGRENFLSTEQVGAGWEPARTGILLAEVGAVGDPPCK